jgi:CBS domain containing-hemolysin-like protein
VNILLAENMPTSWLDIGGLLSVPALVALNGFFVAAEFSLVAVRRTRIEEMVAHGVRGAASVQGAIARIDRVIAATQLGITFSSIALGWFSEQALAHLFLSLFEGMPSPWETIAGHSVAGVLAFFIITYMHVVFGELVPKTLALQAPDRIALWLAGPLRVFELVARPLITIINISGRVVIRLVGLQPSSEHMVHSVEELLLLIEDTEEAGILAPEHAELLQNVFRLTSKKVKDVMVPRDKMAALELTWPPEKVLEAVRAGAHTRMPVYDSSLDNIVGVVNTKNLFYLFSLQGVVVLEDALYPALFLKPAEELAHALQLFRKARRPMALVRDAEGKILGLVTLEDILEEIIGDIEDEHDRPTPKLALNRRLQLLKRRPAAATPRPPTEKK